MTRAHARVATAPDWQQVDVDGDVVEYAGVPLHVGARVVLAPSLGVNKVGELAVLTLLLM